MNKVNPRKEFSHVGLADVRSEIEAMGLKTSWTMAAKAEEYRTSMAMKKAMDGGQGVDAVAMTA